MACAYSSAVVDHGSLPEGAVKILLLGDPLCGKSHLIRAFHGEYKTKPPFSHYSAQVFPCNICVDDETVQLGIYDVPGSEHFSQSQDKCFQKIDVFIFCYAVNSLDSLKSLKCQWIPRFSSYSKNAKTILVGTKADLGNQERRDYPSMDVPPGLGSNLMKSLCLDFFVECSADKNDGVVDVFTNAVILTRQN